MQKFKDFLVYKKFIVMKKFRFRNYINLIVVTIERFKKQIHFCWFMVNTLFDELRYIDDIDASLPFVEANFRSLDLDVDTALLAYANEAPQIHIPQIQKLIILRYVSNSVLARALHGEQTIEDTLKRRI